MKLQISTMMYTRIYYNDKSDTSILTTIGIYKHTRISKNDKNNDITTFLISSCSDITFWSLFHSSDDVIALLIPAFRHASSNLLEFPFDEEAL